jgi:hypothetical protein
LQLLKRAIPSDVGIARFNVSLYNVRATYGLKDIYGSMLRASRIAAAIAERLGSVWRLSK